MVDLRRFVGAPAPTLYHALLTTKKTNPPNLSMQYLFSRLKQVLLSSSIIVEQFTRRNYCSSSFTSRSNNLKNNVSSLSHLLMLEKCCNIGQLKQIHAYLVTLGVVRFAYVFSRLLARYTLYDMQHAYQLFNKISQPTVFDWNTMILGYSRTCVPEGGLGIYILMRRRGVAPNSHTFPLTINLCVRLVTIYQIHTQVLKFGLGVDAFVTCSLVKGYSDLRFTELALQVFNESCYKNVVCWTSLVSGYCNSGEVEKAREVFDKMPEKNDVSWSAMITGYVHNVQYEAAMELFSKLRSVKNVHLNNSLLTSLLNACSVLGSIEDARWIHSYIDEKGLRYGVELGTALMDCYAKSGLIESAREVFTRTPRKDVKTWSAMIMGLAINGQSNSAIDIFMEMLRKKVAPNAITFVGVLTACQHGGLVDKGKEFFNQMSKVYNVSPTIEHYGCQVDLLSRAGEVREAMELVDSMDMEPDGAILGALLTGCLMHGHFEIAERVGRLVTELEPQHCGRYISLANVYASIKRWDNVCKVRWEMTEKKVRSMHGSSLINVSGPDYQLLANAKT